MAALVFAGLLAVLLLSGLPAPAAPARGDNWIIVPGVRVGAVTAKTTPEDLVRAFGKPNVVFQKIPLIEGAMADGAVVFPKDPTKRLSVVWKSVKGRKLAESVLIRDDRSVWKTATGVGMGTTLETLQRLNQRPFKLYGFEWDYGGAVTSWEKGRLETMLKGMAITLRPTPNANISADERKRVIGERPVKSNDPAVRKLQPAIHQIVVRLN
jgi:hypothetical protein